ncbi:MAG: efflux RND transporter periplasmic adaptor subunit [Candidatus Omnitrophica bacterium]|nr:efflux RND transporter periplasmic adaptor subunit [Candidatus Omnitrophota bacterium]MBU1996829.1 efflux RND transporter periplasmic adaptor subunit [Candidatus Omnitrophota bacterium]MBU4334091.1 efflux RND transporter periplasmic adaptor subunit [Candidatus Omnitrophota bacterium]
MIKNFKNELLNESKKHWRLIVVGVIAGLVIANILPGRSSKAGDIHAGHNMAGSSQAKKIIYWTCSMHPQIKLPKKGSCPICAMDLIPVYELVGEDEGGSEVSLTLSESAQKLAEVETAEVKYQEVSNEVRLVGKVDYDETKFSYISAWVPGRIDRLFVDFTGIKVREGDHLIELYSPELLATQEEYLQAIKNQKETTDSQLSVIRDTAKTTLESVKEKLRLYGIKGEQIDEIVKRGAPDEHMTIYSPVTGTVVQKNGFSGMYVKTGDRIYTIADLSKVWVFLDAYESDIQWLHYGQNVKIEAESFPGEVFNGKIAFIEPFVDEKTRTIKLRVNVDNAQEKLKPGMFVRATIHSVLGEVGKVYEEDLAGKWICPMHPDIIKDKQQPCDICGMDLIKTSEFGFAENPTAEKQVLVIPKTAPLITGKRAVVYVENETKKNTTKRYEGREVVLGPRAGDNYIVLSGLKAGERVVTKGNFKIDSALQIQAKPSMMNPAGYYNESENVLTQGASVSSESAGVLKEALNYYLATSKALSEDDPHVAAGNLEKFRDEIDQVIVNNLLKDKTEGLAEKINLLRNKLDEIDHDLEFLRIQFGEVSNIIKDIFGNYEYKEDLGIFLNFCPMAFNNEGGYWLQDSEDIKNPYFGAKMLKCGEQKNKYGRKIIESNPMEGHAGHKM